MTLKVTVKDAVFFEDLDFFSKMDPYVILIIGKNRQQTLTCSEGGKTPRWDQTFTFNVTPQDTVMNVEAWDDDPVTDDFIGETSVNLSKYLGMNGQPVSEYVSMEKRGKHIGRVMMSIQFNQIGMNYGGITNSIPGDTQQQYGYNLPNFSNTTPNITMSNTGQQNWGSNNPAYYNNNSGFDNTTAKAIQGLVGGYINNSEQYPISNPNPFNNMTANVIQSVVANNNYGQQPYETSNPYAVNNGWGPMPPQNTTGNSWATMPNPNNNGWGNTHGW